MFGANGEAHSSAVRLNCVSPCGSRGTTSPSFRYCKDMGCKDQ